MYLHEALKKTIINIDLEDLDRELTAFVSRDSLKRVASFGLRGEVFFPVPCTLRANPFLLGYYRLLFGLSQKEMYNKGPFGRFKRLEDRGDISEKLDSEVPHLCASLVGTAELLVEEIDAPSLSIIHDLQLLTLGPQLRGSENTRLGQSATAEVFDLIKRTVSKYVKETTQRTILVENDSGRAVLIQFASDPDIRITEKMPSSVRPLVSIEIKGGADASNIHNRLGEAEKSHLKARNQGFFEFWTIARVAVEPALVKRASPTTSHFFSLHGIKTQSNPEHRKFRELLGSLLGIRV